MKTHRLLACPFLLVLSSPCIASVSSTVVDVDGQTPAACQVRAGESATKSAADGTFTVDPDAPVFLRIDYRGYAPRLIEPLSEGKHRFYEGGVLSLEDPVSKFL